MMTIDDQIDCFTLLNERLLGSLASAFAILADFLAIVGVNGVMSFVETCCTRGIGIRLALGAPRGAAVGLILRDALLMVVAGVAVALPSVWASES